MYRPNSRIDGGILLSSNDTLRPIQAFLQVLTEHTEFYHRVCLFDNP